MDELTWHGRAGNVPSHIDLRPALCHTFGDGKNFVGNFLIHVILPTIRTDLGRNVFNDKGHSVTIKGNGCCTVFGIPMFANDALHNLLRL